MDKKMIEAVYSLTSMQEGIYYHSINSSNSSQYVLQDVIRIKGDFNVEYAEKALELLCFKYDVLRNCIVTPKSTGMPVQVCLKNRKCETELIDLSSFTDKDERLEEIKNRNVKRGFNLKEDSLMRVLFIKLSEEEHVLLWTTHHIITDGWCTSLVFKDFITYYEKLASGASFNRVKITCKREKENVLSYSDFVNFLRKKDKEEALNYWKEYLGGNNYSVASFDDSYKVNEEGDSTSEITKLIVKDEVTSKLQDICKNNGVTFNSMLEAAYGLLLQKYNNSNDVVFGKVVSGRDVPLKNVEKSVGLFINTIPTRVVLDEDDTVLDFVKKVQKNSISSLKYNHCSLTEIQEKAKVKNDLIDTLFVFENFYVDDGAKKGLKDLEVEIEDVREETNYKVSFSAYLGEQLEIRVLYNPQFMSKEDMNNILKRYNLILEGFISNALIKDIEIIDEEEKRLILEDFNNTHGEYETGKTMDQLFEEAVLENGKKTAVILRDEKITYDELNRKANKIANHLRNLGAHKGDFIAILADKSIETVAEILAVLKSGAAYIPIDVSYPENRIKYILEDSNAKFALCRNEELLKDIDVDIIDSNNISDDLSEDNLEKIHNSRDFAYVIYTSGTTGKPKGVLVEHEGVSNLKAYYKKQMKIESKDIVLQFASLSFDASVSEFAMTLLNGATMCLVPEDIQKDTEKFESYIREHKVTAGILPPAFARMVDTSSIENLMTAGSASSRELVEKSIKDSRYSNDYGPTEGTVCATHWEAPKDVESLRSIPIGKPIINKKIYIMKDGKLCPIGIPGEICISGVGMARGYLNKEELTKAKFIDNPYGEEKLYLAGDLGRWLPDGNIEYLGRIDEQVKIRGFRIETGEIESLLCSMENIKDAAVLKIERMNEELLAAYVVSDEKINAQDIKDSLRKEIPEYMIPSFIVQVDAIELTPNGKVDKRKLQAVNLGVEDEYKAPETELEKKLHEVFKEVLDLDKVSVISNFFEIGGHSLKAMRLVNLIESKANIKVEIKDIFETPTIRSLAKKIEMLKDDVEEKLPKAEEKESYDMSPTQKRMFAIQQIDPDSTAYNMSGAMLIKGKGEKEKIENILSEIIKRHEILRTTFHVEEERYVQKIHNPFELKIEEVKVESLTDEVIDSTMENLVKPFDLTTLPLLKATVVEGEGDSYLLAFDMHHIISDGMSIKNLTEEFTKLYDGIELETLEYQYKDYSEWMNSRDLTEHKNYWVKQFEDEAPVLNLPLDYPRPQVYNNSGDVVISEIDEELSKEIKMLAKKTNTTEYMVLLSAFMVLLSKYSRQEDISVGIPISGRTKRETESMLGMFANTIVMRGKPGKDKSFKDFLNEMKDVCLNGYKYQEYPFDKLVEDLNIKRDLSTNPLFDVMFTMNSRDEITEASNSKFTLISDSKNNGAKFDLSCSIESCKDKYNLYMEYSDVILKKESIELFVNQYLTELSNLCKNSDALLKEVDLNTKSDLEKLLYDFNSFKSELPSYNNMIERFKEVVSLNEESIAIVFEDRKVTYKELDEESDRLAKALLDKGIKKNDIVAVFGNKDIETIASIIAVLKSGAAYVPIDPNYPDSRIKYILEDSNAKIILNSKDENTVKKAETELSKVVCEKNLDDTVYMIYTSGTTGKPKGVMVTEGNLLNYIHYCSESYILEGTKPHIPYFTNLCFDLTVTSIFTTLYMGGTLHIYDGDIQDVIPKVFSNKELNLIKLTPSHLKMALECNENNEKLTNLQSLILGGEELDVSLSQSIIEKYGKQIKIHNEYGPTEATVGCCDYVYSDNLSQDKNTVLIGHPIDNDDIYILNDEKVCGINVPGELCIGGLGVTKGYKNKDDITKAKFVNNPFDEGMLYHSGDLARWLPDGNLEYLGRIDEQVKIRGYRIEVSEVENNIRRINEINDAVVLPIEKNNISYLACYFTSDMNINIRDLKNELRKEIPEYMLPTFMAQVNEIPVTLNGKVDKAKLKEIEFEIEEEYEKPSTEIEEKLEKIYMDLLGLDKVSINSSFFDIGGNSIVAMKLVNRINSTLAVNIQVKDLFENPTIKSLGACIESKEGSQVESIPKAEKKDKYLMTSSQRRLFITHEFSEDKTSYNMPSAVLVSEVMDVNKSLEAIKEIIKRHEILRTSFDIKDGEYVQIIDENIDFNIEEEQVEKLTDEAINHSKEGFVRPFDLRKGALIRVKMTSDKEKTLVQVDMHHIISDGATIYNLIKEFISLYKGEELKDVKLQYKDYSEWLNNKGLDKEREYWLQEFAGEIPSLDLPLDRPRSKNYKNVQGTENIVLENELLAKVRKFEKENNITEYMFLMSAVMMLLGRYARQEDIVIGTPVSGRVQKDTEEMLGLFTNTLALRGYPVKDKKYLDFVQEVKDICLKAYDNQLYPFDELVESVVKDRDLSRNPLFDCAFVLQEDNIKNNDKDKIKILDSDLESTKFDLTFNAMPMEDKLSIDLYFNKGIFNDGIMKYMLEHLKSLIENIVNNPKKSIKDISEMNEEEKDTVIRSFNNNSSEYPNKSTIIDLFEEEVSKYKDKKAIILRDESISFEELNEKANKLARTLIEKGVKTGDFVSILVHCDIETVIAILAIFKAGAAYIPIDYKYPEERVNYILKDSKSRFLLSSRDVNLNNEEVEVINLSDDKSYSEDGTNFKREINESDIAYVIYTSGTTGKPKGVMVEHEGVCNLRQCLIDDFKLKGEEVTLLFASLSFDASVYELCISLYSGNTMCMVPDEIKFDKKAFKEYCKKNEVKIGVIPPNYADEIVLDSLERVITGGSEAKKEMVENYRRVCNYVNVYGPTEATVACTHWYAPELSEELPDRIPIGKPLANKKAYILDGDNLCGIGVPGELCFAGVGTAKGYLNRDELTKEKYVENVITGERMYRTGDLARWLPDGNIEFLGRIDTQVKIRGFRIELGEIESVINELEFIENNAAVVLNYGGDDNIISFIVANKDVEDKEIKNRIKSRLSSFMIPAKFVRVDDIPVTVNGKVDNNKLKEIFNELEKDNSTDDITKKLKDADDSSNDIEREIVNTYREILNNKQLSKEDSFTENGGNSINVMKLVDILNTKYNVSLTFKDVYLEETPENLGKIISKKLFLISEDKSITDTIKYKLNLKDDEFKYLNDGEESILFIDDDILESKLQDIRSDLKENCLREYPSYIFAISKFNEYEWNKKMEGNVQRYIDFILEEKTENGVIEEVFDSIQKDIDKYNSKMINSDNEKSESLSAVQMVSINSKVLASFDEVIFNEIVDINTLNKAFHRIKDIYPALRSKFNISFRNKSITSVKNIEDLDIPYIDLSNRGLKDRQAVEDYIIKQAEEYNNDTFTKGGLISSIPVLIKINEKKYKLITIVSHLIYDGYSSAVFQAKLKEIYNDLLNGKEAVHDKVLSYSDYTDFIKSESEKVDIENLKQELKLKKLSSNIKKFKKTVKKKNIKSVTFKFDVDGLKDMSQEEKLSLFTDLFIGSLTRTFNDRDIPVLAVSDGRRYKDSEFYEYIGEFIDVIPVNLKEGSSADEFIKEMKKNKGILISKNQNFLNLVWEKKISRDMIGVTLFNRAIGVPVFNFVELYKNQEEETYDEISEIKINKDVDMTMGFNIFNDKLILNNILCRKGDEEEMNRHLEDIILKNRNRNTI